jgi:hypothetical protein
MDWLQASVGITMGITVAGCGGADGGEAQTEPSTGDLGTASTGPSETTGDAGTVSGSSSASTHASADASESETAEPPVVFDLGAIPDAPDVEQFGCAGIDFLFVIDNSGSMGIQQEQLLNSFDGFIGAIEDSLENVSSFHVGVVTSDAYTANAPGCTALGDLVTQTQAGFGGGPTQLCTPFADGYRFATDADDLSDKFPCMAEVGTFGSPIEQPVSATIAALSPAKAEPGACNEGFLRDDAILVVVIVTDDPPFAFDMDDAHPDTDTSGWYDAIVAAKGGDPQALVVLGFVPWDDVSCNGAQSPNLIEFVESFGEQGVLASICLPDYGPVFASTIETIETTCNDFVPG